MFYQILLTLHNLTRWAVLLLGVWALYRAYSGWFGRKSWTDVDRRSGVYFAAALGIQFILGALLYFVPNSLANRALGDFSSTVRDPQVRFFVLEHSVVMLVAVIVSNIGSAMARRAPTDLAKFRRAAIMFTITVVLVLVAIPWPFLSYGRPLFRLP